MRRERITVERQRLLLAELGLPDYTDEDAIQCADWPLSRWAWEFTRRRRDLRETFDAHAEAVYRSLLADPNYDGEAPDEPGFWVMLPDHPMFGMTGIPNPRISDQPYLDGLFEQTFGLVLEGQGTDHTRYDHGTHVFIQKDCQIAIVFDVTIPAGQQLAAAKKVLQSYGPPTTRRHHPAKWKLYLRVLDAREVGATYQQIADAIFPAHRPEQRTRARDIFQQACKLRDDFFLTRRAK